MALTGSERDIVVPKPVVGFVDRGLWGRESPGVLQRCDVEPHRLEVLAVEVTDPQSVRRAPGCEADGPDQLTAPFDPAAVGQSLRLALFELLTESASRPAMASGARPRSR